MHGGIEAEKQRAFDRVFGRYGLRIDAPLASEIGLGRVLRDSNRLYPDAYCAYVHNSLPNAVACTSNGHDLIAIFSGLSYTLSAFFASMFSDPSVFEDVGNPSAESLDIERMRTLSNSVSIIALLKCMVTPKCEIRSRMAQSMLEAAHAFVFYHEVGHLEGGHLRLLQDAFGVQVYEEFPVSLSSPDENAVRQSLELDADTSAILTSLRDWRIDWENDSNPLRGKFDCDLIWATAIESVLLFMEWLSARMGTPRATTHPSVFQRITNAKMRMNVVDQSGLQPLSQSASNRGVVRVVLPWMKRHFERDLTRPLFDQSHGKDEGVELGVMLKRLESLYERLDAYRSQRQAQRLSQSANG